MNPNPKQEVIAQSAVCPSYDQSGSVQACAGATHPSSQASPAPAPRLCSRCKVAAVRRPGQFYCRACHAVSMKVYRRQQEQRLNRLKRAIHQMTVENSHTRQAFEKRFGPARHVLVCEKNGGSLICAAKVLRFLPDEKLEVLSETGERLFVDLKQVGPDRCWEEVDPESVPNDAPNSKIHGKGVAGSKLRRLGLSRLPSSAHTSAWRKQHAKQKGSAH
jgi:uncharacterized Zn finger protein (UPF0148 family)